jgi:hypothetical protein
MWIGFRNDSERLQNLILKNHPSDSEKNNPEAAEKSYLKYYSG